MSRSVNKIFLVGRVGRAPDVRTTKGGTKVANTSIATDRRVAAGQEPQTDWHRVVFWDKLAGIVEQYVKSGDLLHVEGSMQYSSYERDGIVIPTAEIHVHEMEMLGSKKEG